MIILFAVIINLIIESDLKFAHVTTAQLSRHVQNWDLIASLFVEEEQHDY